MDVEVDVGKHEAVGEDVLVVVDIVEEREAVGEDAVEEQEAGDVREGAVGVEDA